jgi:hypothetical protein
VVKNINVDEYFGYWIANIVSSSKLIADSDALGGVWINGETGITSAYSVDELLEQLLGDLRLQEHIQQFEVRLRRIGALEEVATFAQLLVEAIKKDSRLESPENPMASESWKNLQKAANRVIQVPVAKSIMR